MWWEFKLILSAVVIFFAALAWRDWTLDGYSRIAFVCLAVVVFAVLWLL